MSEGPERRQRTKLVPMALVIAGVGTAVAAVIESSAAESSVESAGRQQDLVGTKSRTNPIFADILNQYLSCCS